MFQSEKDGSGILRKYQTYKNSPRRKGLNSIFKQKKNQLFFLCVRNIVFNLGKSFSFLIEIWSEFSMNNLITPAL